MPRELNVNSTLSLARRAVERLSDRKRAGNYRAADVDVLLDAFVTLDEHLSAGGEYPDDWDIDESDDDGDEDEDDDNDNDNEDG